MCAYHRVSQPASQSVAAEREGESSFFLFHEELRFIILCPQWPPREKEKAPSFYFTKYYIILYYIPKALEAFGSVVPGKGC